MRDENVKALKALAARVNRGYTQPLQGGKGQGYSVTVGDYSPWSGAGYWVSAASPRALYREVWSAPNGARSGRASEEAHRVYLDALEREA